MTANEKRWKRNTEKWAEAAIKDRIDLEHAFDATATYECTGAQLREYLAYAYRCGQIAMKVSPLPCECGLDDVGPRKCLAHKHLV